jgi:FtsP/CotA-like multicopper oxidase with cupredoxin domain
VVLAPSERAIVDVYFETPGTYALQNKTPQIVYPLGNITVSGGQMVTSHLDDFKKLQTNSEVITSIDKIRPYFTKLPEKSLELTLTMTGGLGNMMKGMMHRMPNGTMMGGSMMEYKGNDGIEWTDAGMMDMGTVDTAKWKIVDKATRKENMDIMWNFTKNKPVVIEVYNDPKSIHPMQHPIHFHGQQFLVISRNGISETNLVWKDTTLVRMGERVEIVLLPSNPGTWMAHCHISEHLASGMMFDFTVSE